MTGDQIANEAFVKVMTPYWGRYQAQRNIQNDLRDVINRVASSAGCKLSDITGSSQVSPFPSLRKDCARQMRKEHNASIAQMSLALNKSKSSICKWIQE